MNWLRLTLADGTLVCVNTAHVARVQVPQTKEEILTLLIFIDGSVVLVRETPETILALLRAQQ